MGIHVGSSSGLSTSDPEDEYVRSIALFATLLCACIVIGHLLEKTRWINQSVTALLIVSQSSVLQPQGTNYLLLLIYFQFHTNILLFSCDTGSSHRMHYFANFWW